MDEQLQQRVRDKNHWFRLGFSLVFFIVGFYVVKLLMAIIVIVQFVISIITGDINQKLGHFGGQLSDYEYQIMRFLSHNSEEKPFPFSDWPKAGE